MIGQPNDTKPRTNLGNSLRMKSRKQESNDGPYCFLFKGGLYTHSYLSKPHQDKTVPWDVYLSLSSLAEFVCESQLSCILV